MPLVSRKPRQQKKNAPEQRVGRRGRAQANEEELLKQLAALQAGTSLEDIDDIELEKMLAEPEEEEKPAREMPVSMEPPHMRFNAQLTVQNDVLFIYGGTYEKGDREFTFDDLYAIDLVKLDGYKEIFNKPVEDWIVSLGSFTVVACETHELTEIFQESEDEEDEDEDEEDEDEEEDEDDEDDQEEPEQQIRSESKRKKKQDEVSEVSSEAPTPSITSEEEETETTATSVDDGLPHPRVSPLSLQSLFHVNFWLISNDFNPL